MKWKIALSLFILTALFVIVECGQNAYSNSSGAPAGYCGSPADVGKTCANTGCHTGSAVTPVTGWITSTIPSGGYVPGTTYTITATATFNGRTKFGFQVSPQDAAGNKMGTLVNTNGQTQVQLSGKYVTHTTAGNSNPNFKTWNFDWTAPPSGSGALTFYGSFNCTNSNNMSSGDLIFTSTLATTEDSTNGLDCGIFKIMYPNLYVCSSTFSPIVTLENYGTTVLDSVLINYQVDANTPSSFWYVGVLNTFTSVNVTLPPIAAIAGAHTFTAFTSLPNNSTDLVLTNDSKTSNFTGVMTAVQMPFMEGFEATTFPPVNWKIINPDASTTWARTVAAHSSGVASTFLNNYSYSAMGQKDELVTPTIDLTSNGTPSLYFQLAYNLFTNPLNSPNYSDTLTVLLSTDCGVTWTQIYKKFGAALTTKVPDFQNSAFTPTASQWRLETVSLTPYNTCSNAIFKFINTCSFENRLYLDDIQISGPMDVYHFDPNELNVGLFPNPSTGNFTMEYSLAESSIVTVKMFDAQGKLVTDLSNAKEKDAGTHLDKFDVSELPEGLYFVMIKTGKYSAARKIVITK